jgi:hypothetical protein
MTHERELDVGHDVEVLEGCRGATGMTALDFTAAAGLARLGSPRPGQGMRVDVVPAASDGATADGGKLYTPVTVYCIAAQVAGSLTNNREPAPGETPRLKILVGLRRDFELLGAAYGRCCDAIEARLDKAKRGT